jgi:hypothetical protein
VAEFTEAPGVGEYWLVPRESLSTRQRVLFTCTYHGTCTYDTMVDLLLTRSVWLCVSLADGKATLRQKAMSRVHTPVCMSWGLDTTFMND